MVYYNYHAIAKNLISSGHCIGATQFKRYKHIYPALVLYFDNHRPFCIRVFRWFVYIPLLGKLNIDIALGEELG